MAYATIVDFYAFQGKTLPDPIPADIIAQVNSLLDAASDKVDEYTRFATYRTNPDGSPAAEFVVYAFMRATCAQAVYFQNNPTSLSEGVRQFDSIKAGSLSLSTNAGSNTGAGKGSLTLPTDSARAFQILVNAGILRSSVSGRL